MSPSSRPSVPSAAPSDAPLASADAPQAGPGRWRSNPALTRRSLLSLGVAASAMGALAACGSNTGRDEAPVGGGGTSGGSTPTLNQWYHQYGEAGTQQAVQRYAKEYPDATVKVTWKPGDYDQSMVATLLTAGAPDVFEYGNGPTIDMITGGQVADLSDLFGDAKADFDQALIDRVTYQGKIYAIPQVLDSQVLVYRKSALQKAGVTPPATVDELLAAAKTLTSGDVKGLFVGNDGGVSILGGPMLWASGLDYLTKENTFGFDDPKAVAAFTKLRELFASKTLLLGAPKDWFDASALTQGLAAMQFTGLWNLPAIEKAIPGDYGVLPWPAMPGGAPAVPVGAYGACVFAKGKNVDAAKKFVKWLWIDSTDRQLDWAQSYGFHIPARQSLVGRAEKLKSGPAAEAAKIVTDHGHAQTPLLWTPKCSTAFGDMMTRIVKEGADPKAEIAKVKAVAEAELERLGV
ncbi:ABC transporter substrate-binding protein [Agilicoccus flavus]|uniref:ABC transporter substrate-binding protein n=1 Tax=Agilicoccus flavus TaxID=2775968 RepID=UPI001CF66E1C|nr:sugar ABC transporter substrate-binding protein [Agilicoccus flavus]